MELMMHLHLNNNRQGPGDENATKLALQLAQIDTTQPFRVADIGCGTGAQTVTLAKLLKGEIIAVDIFDTFLQKMKERIYRQNLQANISMLAASMDDLPFKKKNLTSYGLKVPYTISDSEKVLLIGKIFLRKEAFLLFLNYHGLQTAALNPWKTSGSMNILKSVRHPRKSKYWKMPDTRYSDILFCRKIVGPKNYYIPLLKSHDNFIRKFGHISLAHKIVETDRQEMEFYSKYKEYYSYGFYIARKI